MNKQITCTTYKRDGLKGLADSPWLCPCPRSLSELEGVRLGGDTDGKIRQVTERATLFRITSNAMINVRVVICFVVCDTGLQSVVHRIQSRCNNLVKTSF